MTNFLALELIDDAMRESIYLIAKGIQLFGLIRAYDWHQNI